MSEYFRLWCSCAWMPPPDLNNAEGFMLYEYVFFATTSYFLCLRGRIYIFSYSFHNIS